MQMSLLQRRGTVTDSLEHYDRYRYVFFLHFKRHKRKEEGRVELLRSYTRHNPSIGLKGSILL